MDVAENNEYQEIATTDDIGVAHINNNTKKGGPVAEDPGEKKDINSNVGANDVADNDNAIPLEGGEAQEGENVEAPDDQGNGNAEVELALPDGDVSMDIAGTTSNIQDTVDAGLVTAYGDNELRMEQARFPDGSHSLFTVHVRDTVGDVNRRLNSVFGNDAFFLGVIDGDRVSRANPSSVVYEIAAYEHIRLAFGHGSEAPDEGD